MITILFLVALAASSQAQDANSLAQFIHDSATSFFQTYELVKLEQKIVEQACAGATVQQIFDNFQTTVTDSIGGATAANLFWKFQQLSNDLGDDFSAVKAAAANAAINDFTPLLNDAAQYCSQGSDSVLSRAAQLANYDLVKGLFDHLYGAISAVNPNAWNTCRNDLANEVNFQNYGY